MKNEGWEKVNRWKMKDERWKIKDERWKIKDEGWKIKDERWKIKDVSCEIRDKKLKMRYFIGPISENNHLRTMLCLRFVSFFHSLQKSNKIAIRLFSNAFQNNLMATLGKKYLQPGVYKSICAPLLAWYLF